MLTDYFSKIDLAWLSTPGDKDEGAYRSRALVPLVSQVKIRRNLAEFPFPGKCDNSQLYDVAAVVLSRIGGSDTWQKCDSRMLDNLDDVSKNLLLEKRLISPSFMQGGAGRFIVRDCDGTISCMINEVDHLSIAVSLGGLELHESYRVASALNEALALKYAKDTVLGYLTADPGSVGTGMQASVLLHLPGLDYTGGIKRASLALDRDWPRVALYKLAQHSGEPAGSFYLASNKVTLAISPVEIVSMLQGASELLTSRELLARREMKDDRDETMIDRFWRSWGTLRHARLLSLEEAINALSFVKLGSELGYLPPLPDDEWKHMFITSQPYHLNAEARCIVDESEELSLRATLFRRFIENRSST